MPSFDVVSEVDGQELDNAVNILKKEIENRYDFKGSNTTVELNKKDKKIHMVTNDDMKIKALREMLIGALIKRSIDPDCLDFKDPEPTGNRQFKRDVIVKEGLDKEVSKKIVKMIKDSKLKVQASIMDDKVRVQGKKIDDLQEVIQFLKTSELGIPLQYVNMKS
ncbi:MAG: YajQ family cyclic di-GMP-binding protein [Geovibrio sp.]|uniref:YajQ family cyclic di-GMP-binding protein n=1 Tax=Geovibrio ferrireducens TaxID=46201 RepID=UPI00224815B8|nr:YajQ family cyclic di-GMP-binding protein [Geovibrio ferrireducens]MCD8569254.1 YajQ family cyclic di-GMP-binding protein [Geovibrio sp.]